LLSAAFPKAERGRAVGTWSAATTVVGAVSPMLGGWFVDVGSWRVAFSTVVPPALVLLAVAVWRVPDAPVMRRAPPVDWAGAVLATVGLFAVVTGTITIGTGIAPLAVLTAGGAILVWFARHERRTATPMVPPALFGSRAFSGINVLTLLVYGGVAGAFFVLPFNLVQVQGYSSTATGAAFLPFALLVGVLSRRVGGLADRIGTKRLLVGGALVTAAGVASFALSGLGRPYWTTFLAPMVLTVIGMAFTAPPLTTSVLASVKPAEAGVASGVNNTAARLGTLLPVAIIGVVSLHLYERALQQRLSPVVSADIVHALLADRRSLADTTIPARLTADRSVLKPLVDAAFLDGFRGSVLLCAAAVLAGAVIAFATVDVADAASVTDARALSPTCAHVSSGLDATPRTRGCEQCLLSGDTWVHLRVCVACGQVGCCDSSKNRHATQHFWASRHPIVRSLERGEEWRWCYIDEVAV
jgi:MFS family permease